MNLHTLLDAINADRRWVVLVMLFTVPIILAIGQVLFKMASLSLSRPDASLRALAVNPYLLSALALYGGATLLWLLVLSRVELGRAYPSIALTFVLVPLLAHLFFGEVFGLRYMLGVLLIVAGIVLSQT